MDGNFTVISNEEAILLRNLKAMYNEVRSLTMNHNNLEGYAVVYPSDLGVALERVRVDWWKEEL